MRHICRSLMAGLATLATLGFAFLSMPRAVVAQDSDAHVAARSAALELAGAFSNDGFKLRDGHWLGTTSTTEPLAIGVSLYSGNSYWFTAAAVGEGAKISIEVLDETGKPLEIDTHSDGARCAAGITAPHSGLYTVRIRIADSANAQGKGWPLALVYSYK